MGTGVGQGENRAAEAAQRAISNPLLEDSSIEGAKGVIVNITGGSDLSLSEASEATALITKVADPDANVIYGIVTDESMGSAVKVTVIATGFQRGPRKAAATPVDLANYMTTPQAAPAQQAAAATGDGFYRKTPNVKAAAAGGSRFDLDVPAFLRRKGGGDVPSE
jgi:cell division protein FtsZ